MSPPANALADWLIVAFIAALCKFGEAARILAKTGTRRHAELIRRLFETAMPGSAVRRLNLQV
ncbi:MAG: hypothetical protein ACREDV_10185 [Methylocella sp.]